MDSTLRPCSPATEVLDGRTWRPACLRDVRSEAAHVVRSAAAANGDEPVVLFRGQSDSTWTIRSTFARNCEGRFDVSDQWYGNQIHQAYLDKFGGELGPSKELLAAADTDGIDPWFELMKRMQQHPDEFHSTGRIPGTNLLDWTQEIDVALAFAAENPWNDGVLLVLDTVACGRIFVPKPMLWVLETMQSRLNDGQVAGLPQLYCPPKQLRYQRVDRQRPYYVAQMDLRFPLEEVLAKREAATHPHLILRCLIVTSKVKREIDEDLARRGRSREWLLEMEPSNAEAVA